LLIIVMKNIICFLFHYLINVIGF
ncbi:hypothetical protein, partial [Candidatus Stoquefichus massiliensis]